jgi:CRP-like cAMP-binding protein
VAESTVLEKMVGLTSIAILGDLGPEELSELARTGTEVWFRQGEALCRQGELTDEVFALLDGEVSIVQSADGVERVLGTDGPGTSIGELAVLDPAPRAATVVAATVAVRALRLSGGAFRAALQSNPAVSESVIRMLVRRLRAGSRDS